MGERARERVRPHAPPRERARMREREGERDRYKRDNMAARMRDRSSMRRNAAILRQAITYPADCVPREHFEMVFAKKHVRALPPVHRESGETTATENALAPAIMHRSPNKPAYEGTATIMFMLFKIAGKTRLHIILRSLKTAPICVKQTRRKPEGS